MITEKIRAYIDKKIPPKLVIKLNSNDPYGYMEKRHYPELGGFGAMSMLSYAVAKELQYICHGKDDKKTAMKAIIRDFEQGTLRLACDMCDKEYIYKPIIEEEEE